MARVKTSDELLEYLARRGDPGAFYTVVEATGRKILHELRESGQDGASSSSELIRFVADSYKAWVTKDQKGSLAAWFALRWRAAAGPGDHQPDHEISIESIAGTRTPEWPADELGRELRRAHTALAKDRTGRPRGRGSKCMLRPVGWALVGIGAVGATALVGLWGLSSTGSTLSLTVTRMGRSSEMTWPPGSRKREGLTPPSTAEAVAVGTEDERDTTRTSSAAPGTSAEGTTGAAAVTAKVPVATAMRGQAAAEVQRTGTGTTVDRTVQPLDRSVVPRPEQALPGYANPATQRAPDRALVPSTGDATQEPRSGPGSGVDALRPVQATDPEPYSRSEETASEGGAATPSGTETTE